MEHTAYLYAENDSPVSVTGLTDEAGDPVTGATVAVEIYRGETLVQAATLAHSSGGDYHGRIPYPLYSGALEVGEIVRLKYIVTSGATDGTWYADKRVRRRLVES